MSYSVCKVLFKVLCNFEFAFELEAESIQCDKIYVYLFCVIYVFIYYKITGNSKMVR